MEQLRTDQAAPLPKLWGWYARMADQCPVRFKGKRAASSEAPDQPIP